MSRILFENLKFLIAGEWCGLMLALFLMLFRKRVFELFETFTHLARHLLVSVSALTAFAAEAVLLFANHLGTQSSLSLLGFYIEHLAPWLLLLVLCDLICYIFERISFIIKNAFLFGIRSLSGARIDICPYESKDLITPVQRIVLLQ